jgi:ABC-2 type transport system permease protein
VKPYLVVLRARFGTLLQYRTAALAGIVTQVVFGYIRMMIFEGFYRSSNVVQPMTREETIGYIWLGQALLGLVMWGTDNDVAGMIRDGSVAYELARPIDLFGLWYMRCISARAAVLALRAPPILLIAWLVFGLQGPVSTTALGLFLLSIVGAILLSAVTVALCTISLMWTVSGEGISRLLPPLIFVLSGIIIPLPLFPRWAQPILNAMPWRGLIDVPFRIYLGNLNTSQALMGLMQQGVWIGLFILLGHWLVGRGVRRLVVQGG